MTLSNETQPYLEVGASQMRLNKFDISIVSFALVGGALLKLLADVPFVLGTTLSLVAYLLHPALIAAYRLYHRFFGSKETLLFFALSQSARRDEIRREEFARLADHYCVDFEAEGIQQVKKYRKMIEDMNAHHARFPTKRTALKSTYLRRGLRDLSRFVKVDPTNATRQFDLAMAQVHAPEFKKPTNKMRRLTQELFSRAIGRAEG